MKTQLTLPLAHAAPPPIVPYDYPEGQGNGIALVGEAPGADETRLGHPFVGRSGQLLDKMLAEAGIVRQQCLVANIFRIQPPANKVDHFFISRRAAHQEHIPIAEELGKFGSLYCRQSYASEWIHLKETLQAKPPRVVIALGRTPLWGLTGENGLLERVGTWLPCRFLSTLPVMPTYHPSFILRGNWKLRDSWLKHFETARDLAQKNA